MSPCIYCSETRCGTPWAVQLYIRAGRQAWICSPCANKEAPVPMFKVEVVADSSGKWVGNSLRFDTVEAAVAYAQDLYSRWTAVREWQVVDANGIMERRS